MSSSNSREESKKRKDVWEEAGGEFYQESYPSGSGPSPKDRKKSIKPATRIPLPSASARRNSTVHGRRSLGNKRKNSYSVTTCNSTYAAGTSRNNIEKMSLLPDLSEDQLPDERATEEELMKLKSLPVSMVQKRILKSQLSAIPKLRLKGWKGFKWKLQTKYKVLKRKIVLYLSRKKLMQTSLEEIEEHCGISILNVFLFIKWNIKLNFVIFLLSFSFIIFPQLIGNSNKSTLGSLTNESNCEQNFADMDAYIVQENFSRCCNQLLRNSDWIRDPEGYILRYFSFDHILFYGYYFNAELQIGRVTYPMELMYALTVVVVLLFGFFIMIRNVARGLLEVITYSEGEFFACSNLVFAGWDHSTSERKAAEFKRKTLVADMKKIIQEINKRMNAKTRKASEEFNLTLIRVGVNLVVIGILAGVTASVAFSYYYAANAKKTYLSEIIHRPIAIFQFFKELSPFITIGIANCFAPIIFQPLGKLEKYSDQMAIILLILRSLFVKALSVGYILFLFYTKYYCESSDTIEKSVCGACREKGTDVTSSNSTGGIRCWESLLGDIIYQTLFVDFLLQFFIVYVVGFAIRSLRTCRIPIIRNTMPREFNLATNSLDIIYIQMLAWLGIYFAPPIAGIALIYGIILFYMKKYFALKVCSVAPTKSRITRTASIFILAKLFSLTFVIALITFMMTNMLPSRGCGPMYRYRTPLAAVTSRFHLQNIIEFITGLVYFPSSIMTFSTVMIFVNYYYYSIAKMNRNMVETLKHLLILEGHDKQFLFGKLNYLKQTHQSHRQSTDTLAADPNLSAGDEGFLSPNRQPETSRFRENETKV